MRNKIANYNKTIKKINFFNVFIPLFCLSAPAVIVLTLHHFGLINRFLDPMILFIFMIIIPAYYLKWHKKQIKKLLFPIAYYPHRGTKENSQKDKKEFDNIHHMKEYIQETSSRMYLYNHIEIEEIPESNNMYLVYTKVIGKRKCNYKQVIGYIAIQEEENWHEEK